MSRHLCTLLVFICEIYVRFGLGSLGGNAVWTVGLVGGKVCEGCDGW